MVCWVLAVRPADLTVVVADPSPLIREVLAGAFVGTDIVVVGCAGSTAELLSTCHIQLPQVVVAASSFVDGHLVDVLAEILRGGSRVLVVSDAARTEAVPELLLAGASGCLFVQDAGPAEVVAATREVAKGNAALHPAAAAAVLRHWRAAQEPVIPVQRRPSITPRESEVLDGLARGLPTKQIGRDLGVSPKTVEAHVARLLVKLAARNRAHAVSLAMSHGLLSPDDA